MKKIGLIGGLTWISTIEYYRLLNQFSNEKCGGFDNAEILIWSVNFGDIKKFTEAGDWNAIANIICAAASALENCGASCILLGANTMHKIADEVQAAVQIPLMHIAEVTAKAIAEKGLERIVLLGTKYTMQLDFYHNHLAAYGIETIIPCEADIEMINTAIYNEMSRGIFSPSTKADFLEVIEKLQAEGGQGVILGCTEIPLLIQQADCTIPIFDTTLLHCKAAVEFAIPAKT